MASIISSAVLPAAVSAPVLPPLRKIRANGASFAASLRSRGPRPLGSTFQGTPFQGAKIRAQRHYAAPAAGGAAVVAAASPKGTGKGTVVIEPDPRIPIVLLGASRIMSCHTFKSICLVSVVPCSLFWYNPLNGKATVVVKPDPRIPIVLLAAFHAVSCHHPFTSSCLVPVMPCCLFSSQNGNATVVVEPDPHHAARCVPMPCCRVSGALFLADNKLAAAPIGLLGAPARLPGAFSLPQTTRVRFVFGEEALETTRVRFVFGEEALEVRIGQQLESSGENVFVGGENKWRYDTFVNWEYDTFVNWEFWWASFPVLVYFKETQTRPEGQVHFFPIIANGKQRYDVMVERCGAYENTCPDGNGMQRYDNGKQLYDVMVERCGPSWHIMTTRVPSFPPSPSHPLPSSPSHPPQNGKQLYDNGKQLYDAMVERCGPSKGSGPSA
ncbi:unnamed protein product [Closterium sp. NIES-64]|nr:unnamed protein product [Closterium sp. NIES-64]